MAKGRDIHQTETNLLNYGEKKKENLKRRIIEKENEEISKYSFMPTLTARQGNNTQVLSSRLGEFGYNRVQESGIYKVHTKLYEYAGRQKKAKEQIANQQEHSFSPLLYPSKYDKMRKSKFSLFNYIRF